ncbi:MAG: response regulator transcription factor [Anaerolineales bacterium]|nr:response regulator transcription factor [Anaerolineales bacterium]
MNKIRYMIVDDQQIIREGLGGMLSREKDLELVGSAQNGAEAVEKAISLNPDIILMDLRMPELDGVEAIRRIRKICPHTKCIILTVYNNDENIFEGIRAGAKAYIMKDISQEELVHVIRSVYEGKAYLQPELTSKLLEKLTDLPELAPTSTGRLSERELDILKQMAAGKSNKEIAGSLFISEHTVKTHITNIFGKLEVNNRAEAVTRAIQKGIITV